MTAVRAAASGDAIATAANPAGAEPSPPGRAARRRILALLTLWFAMALIDVGIVNVALPSIQRDLGATPSDLQWILSGYALTFGVVLIAAGRAGDVLGRGGIFLVGMTLFTAASLAAALASAPGWLNAARFVEGIGAGFMSPQVYGMVQQFFHGAERGRAFGFLGMATSLAVAIAPGLGGLLIGLGGLHWGWRLTFLINVPLGVVGVVLGMRWLPKPLMSLRAAPGRTWVGRGGNLVRTLDPVGMLLAGLTLLTVLVPFVEYHAAPAVWWLLPAGAACAAAWVLWERGYARRGHPPMVDLDLFRLPSLRNGLLIQTLYFLGMTSIWVLVALYAQEAAGKTAFEAGLLGIPSALVAAWFARWSGRRVSREGRRLVIRGQAVALAGLALSALAIALCTWRGTSVWWLLATFAVYGAGQGMSISPNQTLTLDAVPLGYAGSAGALVSVSQRVGASVGIAAVTAVVFGTLPHASWGVATLAGFALIALLVLAAIAVGVHDLRQARAR